MYYRSVLICIICFYSMSGLVCAMSDDYALLYNPVLPPKKNMTVPSLQALCIAAAQSLFDGSNDIETLECMQKKLPEELMRKIVMGIPAHTMVSVTQAKKVMKPVEDISSTMPLVLQSTKYQLTIRDMSTQAVKKIKCYPFENNGQAMLRLSPDGNHIYVPYHAFKQLNNPDPVLITWPTAAQLSQVAWFDTELLIGIINGQIIQSYAVSSGKTQTIASWSAQPLCFIQTIYPLRAAHAIAVRGAYEFSGKYFFSLLNIAGEIYSRIAVEPSEGSNVFYAISLPCTWFATYNSKCKAVMLYRWYTNQPVAALRHEIEPKTGMFDDREEYLATTVCDDKAQLWLWNITKATCLMRIIFDTNLYISINHFSAEHIILSAGRRFATVYYLTRHAVNRFLNSKSKLK